MEVNKVIYKVIKISLIVLLVLIVVYGTTSLTVAAYDFGYRVFTESPIEAAPGTNVSVTINENMSEKELGKMLYDKGLIRDENLFFLQLKISAYSGKLVPGTYTLNTSMTPKEMIIIMAQAEVETEE